MELNHRRHTLRLVTPYPLHSYPAVRENDLTRIRSCSLFTGPQSFRGSVPFVLIKLIPFFQQSQLLFESVLLKLMKLNCVPKPRNGIFPVLNLNLESFSPLKNSSAFTLRKLPERRCVHVITLSTFRKTSIGFFNNFIGVNLEPSLSVFVGHVTFGLPLKISTVQPLLFEDFQCFSILV
jgi:hypothetical protein